MSKRGKWDSSSDEDLNKNSNRISTKKLKTDSNQEESRQGAIKPVVSRANTSVQPDLHERAIIDDEKKTRNADLVHSKSTEVLLGLSDYGEDEKPLENIKRSHNPLFDGCRSVNEYVRLNFISEGTYGLVFRAKCKTTNEYYALKQIKFGADATHMGFPLTALRETNILLSLNHPNIMKVKEMVVGSSIDKIFMVMEYADNDLKYCLDQSSHPFSTAEVKQLLIQFLKAVDHMHRHWIIHRDLKPSNLLYSNKGKLTVCDYGMARKYDSPVLKYTREVVTLWYRCPELLLGSQKYSTPLDMWSVGCIFAEMLSTKPLFPGEGEIDQTNKIFYMTGAPSEERWKGWSKLPNAGKISSRVGPRCSLPSRNLTLKSHTVSISMI